MRKKKWNATQSKYTWQVDGQRYVSLSSWTFTSSIIVSQLPLLLLKLFFSIMRLEWNEFPDNFVIVKFALRSIHRSTLLKMKYSDFLITSLRFDLIWIENRYFQVENACCIIQHRMRYNYFIFRLNLCCEILSKDRISKLYGLKCVREWILFMQQT